MADFIEISPSARSVYNHMTGKPNPLPLPDDCDAVAKVVEDFKGYFELDWNAERYWEPRQKWWREEGQFLFGIPAPAPKVRVFDPLTAQNKGLHVAWNKHDCLVAQIPLGQSLAATMRQLKAQLSKHPFAESAIKQQPKYSFQPSKMREATLGQAIAVLGDYMRSPDLPLWWIGNFYRVLPGVCFDEEEAAQLGAGEVAYRKEIIGIATSRLIKKGLLVAENAARGRFPSTNPFPEAMTGVFKRKSGRPQKHGD